jgi:hypothetical protein
MGVSYPTYSIFKRAGQVKLTGRSLLPDLEQPASSRIERRVTVYTFFGIQYGATRASETVFLSRFLFYYLIFSWLNGTVTQY